jgi:hypothetical protein
MHNPRVGVRERNARRQHAVEQAKKLKDLPLVP